ncbi:hypothetical protein BROUX41_004471 [Berkeleyomyces rouxiae]|uniref:uncharacterized protein n=1 Tax=Berkeleyomyces rouxiae TaxID=2035830 RepID=UPI003B796897
MGNGKEASETSNSQVAEGSGCVDTTTSLGFETLHMHPPQNSQVEIIDGPATIGTLPAGVVPQSYAVIQTPYEPALAQDYLQSSSSLCPSQLPDVSPGSTPNRDIFTVPGGEGSNWAVYQPQPPQIAHDGSILLGEVQSSPGSLVYESETSTDQTPPIPRRTQRTRGPFVDEKMKNDTAKTRRLGCCIRCRMQRIRCVMKDGSSQCDTCTKAQPKVWRLPCVRYNITDMQLYKPTGGVENLRWTERWSDVVFEISTWASSTVRKIRIGDRYTSGFVEVPVREFKPQPGDKLVRTWTTPDGQKKSVPVPNYAICDLKRAGAEFHKYLETGFCECFETVAKPVDDMMLRTYKLAWSIYQDPNLQEPKKEVLDKALKLWMCIRLTTTSQTIVGEDTLDMSRDIMDETSPIHGKIPLPPVMGAQIDLILIETIQKSLRKRLLKLLQEMARKNDKSTWLVLYLVTFIMLHNIALITAHDAGYAQKHGLERRFAREKKVSEYHLGANILLSYWHYCCKGLYPFSEGCSQKELESLAELDEGEIRYVRDMREYISNERDKWDEIHRAEQYENDFYFVSQIFQRGWEPGSTKTFTHV